jgi:hypothetical protein
MRLILSCTGVLAVGVTSFTREGTDPRSLERSSAVERRFCLEVSRLVSLQSVSWEGPGHFLL